MAKALVSILITTHNRCHSLQQLLAHLAHLLEAELRASTVEILVFDDASSDQTSAIMQSFTNIIRPYSASHNVGYIEARRRLISLANGQYLFSLDDDSSLLDPNALDIVRSTFAEFPSCGAIAANIATRISTKRGLAPTNMAPVPTASFIGCGHALRTDLVRQVGGYPGFLTGYGAEEMMLSLAILDRGWQVVFQPSLRVFHAEDGMQRNFVAQRAGTLVNELAIVAYAYPGWLVIPFWLKKIASFTYFNWKQRSTRAVARAARTAPRTIMTALRYRKPVRVQTLQQFFGRRRSFAAATASWSQRSCGDGDWPEIDWLFTSN